MSKKIPLGIVIAIFFLTVAVTIAVTVAVFLNKYNDVVEDVPKRAQVYSNLSDIDELIRSNYYADVDTDTLDDNIAKGYVEGLNDKYSYYMTADEYAEFSKQTDDSLTYAKLGTVGYMRIYAFYDNTIDKFNEAITFFNDNSISNLIIDVRDNNSINLSSAIKIIDAIVPIATEGTKAIATIKDANDDVKEYFSSDANSINMSIVVITNKNTNGVAELLACDLRDFGKAVIYGEMTAGHGTTQNVFTLDNGDAIVLSVGEIYPYISDSYNGTGVIPDTEVFTAKTLDAGKEDYSEDAQITAAIAYFSE